MTIRMFGLPLLAAVMVSAPVMAAAEGLPITPGLWEVKTANPMFGTEEVEQHCMQEAVFDPAAMFGDQEGCEISNKAIAGNRMNYDLTCADGQQPGSATGHFSFTIDGDQGSGNVEMVLDINGQTMNMNYSMAASRVGDC